MVAANGNYVAMEECTHHWGKSWKRKSKPIFFSFSILKGAKKISGLFLGGCETCGAKTNLDGDYCDIAFSHIEMTTSNSY